MFLLLSGSSVHRGGCALPVQPSDCWVTLGAKPDCLQVNEMKNEIKAEGLVQPISAFQRCLKG